MIEPANSTKVFCLTDSIMRRHIIAKRNTSGGVIAQHGFILQPIIAITERHEKDNLDAIKVYPERGMAKYTAVFIRIEKSLPPRSSRSVLCQGCT